jgi:hypothetical protein
MAAVAVGITTGDGAFRWRSPATDTGATMDRHGIEVTMGRRSDRDCGLTSMVAGTRRGTPRQIRPSERGTTARRISQFRTAYVSRTEGAKPVSGEDASVGSLDCW